MEWKASIQQTEGVRPLLDQDVMAALGDPESLPMKIIKLPTHLKAAHLGGSAGMFQRFVTS